MSDMYMIGSVAVQPLGGGYYELSHVSLETPEKVRGKEEADKRATALDQATAPAEGSMEPQGEIPEVKASEDDKDAQIAALKAQLEAAREGAKASEDVRTVLMDPEAPPVGSYVPNTVPLSYTKTMDKEQRQMFSKAELAVARIVLEENENIPPTGLFISHNGRAYMISPGEEVDVPEFLLAVLDDAITSNPVIDTTTRKVLGYRNRMKYPYRRVR